MKTKKAKKRAYYGERIAGPLLAWLYASDTPESERRTLLKLLSLGRQYQDSPDRHERELLKERVNGILDGLKFSPMLFTSHGVWGVRWEAATYGSAADAVRLWLELVSRGLLPRLRQCKRKLCPRRRWYFARFDHTAYCSVGCRTAEEKEDPERRKSRQEYEKLHYKEEKERDREALRNVRKVRS